MKIVRMHRDHNRNVWIDHVTGFSVVHWDEQPPKHGPQVTREKMLEAATKSYAERFRLKPGEFEIVFDESRVAAKRQEPLAVKMTNFIK